VIRWFQQDSSQILARPLFLQVVLCKFHSVFLTEEGVVLTCGHGRGGRLAMAMNKELLSVSFHSLTPLSGMIFAYDFQTRYKIIVCQLSSVDVTIIMSRGDIYYLLGL